MISPYTQRGIVDSHFYSQTSALRTLELLMGLGPLTQYGVAAVPMTWTFGDRANLTPYDTLATQQSLSAKNPANATSAMTPQARGDDPTRSTPTY